jgi:hypothetical protein
VISVYEAREAFVSLAFLVCFADIRETEFFIGAGEAGAPAKVDADLLQDWYASGYNNCMIGSMISLE